MENARGECCVGMSQFKYVAKVFFASSTTAGNNWDVELFG